MIKNFILASWRSLLKKISFTIINILGLAVGMTTCLLIFLYVQYDLSYDDFQDENVYRMWINRVYPEREVNYPQVPHSFGPQLVEDIPEILAQGRCFSVFNPVTIQVGDDFYLEERMILADSFLLSVIDIPLKSGDPATALSDANSVILSESTAKKLFGGEEALGKTLDFFGSSKKVTAIAYDYPENSHFAFDYIASVYQFPFFSQPNWVAFSAMTYIRLQEGTDPASIEEKLPAFVKKYAEGPIQQRNGISYDEYIKAGNGYNYHLHNIQDIHLHSNLENEIKANGNINYIYIFSVIAVFILGIACINFMNLSTARSTERGKEVGIRKVLGSEKKQLVGQFLTESIIVTALSAMAAIAIASLTLGPFRELAGRPLSMQQILQPTPIFVIVAVVAIVGVISGLYPAFFISGFSPLSVLKGKLKTSKQGIQLRNGLVVLQFAISITLISATLIVYDQMNFMLNKPLGFENENVIVVENAGNVNGGSAPNLNRFETFKNEVNAIPNVTSSAYSSNMPGDFVGDFSVRVPGSGQKESMIMRQMVFDDEMIETLQIDLLEGRFFSKEFEDSLNIVLNRSAVEKLGLTQPIGEKVIQIAANADPIEYTVVGVIDDFHFQSLHVDLKPAAFTSMEGPNSFITKMAIKINGDQVQSTMDQIQEKWAEFVPGAPFRSYFLDTSMEQFYKNERATGQIFGIFTFLAIIIACVGLLGLSAFIINQRVKEIGVRKVLGATIPQIIMLISKDFIKLVAAAAVVAIPAAYFWMSSWLEDFAYAVGVNWLIFLFAGFVATFVAVATVSFQSIKAATANPVKSLRDE